MTRIVADFSAEELYLQGVVENAYPADYSLWRNAYNVVYHDGTLRSLPALTFISGGGTLFDSLSGATQILFDSLTGFFDSLSSQGASQNLTSLSTTPVLGLYQYKDSNDVTITIVSSADKIFSYSGVTGSTIGASYTTPTFSFANFGDWVFGTNGSDAPIVIKLGVISAPDEAPTTAQSVLVYNGFLMYFGVNTDKKDFVWSGYNNPEVLDPQTDATAGTFTTQKLRTGHVVAVSQQNYIILYTRDQHALVEFVGRPNYFGMRDPLPFGVLNKRCVASDGRHQYGLSENGLFVTDGFSVQTLGDGRLTKYYNQNADLSKSDYFFVCYDVSLGAAKFFYRRLDGIQEALVYYPGQNQFLIERYDACIGHYGVNGRVIYGFSDGSLYEQQFVGDGLDTGVMALGLSATLRSKWISPGKEYARTYFDYFALRMPFYAGSVICKCVAVDERGVEQQGPALLVSELHGKVVRIPLQRNALYAYVEVQSNPDAYFAISGLQVIGKLEGRIQ